MYLSVRQFFILVFLFTFFGVDRTVQAQALFKDSTDGAFDVSDWLISAHGFLPIATIITEPALGSFGVAVAPIFFQPKTKYMADTTIKNKPLYVPPDVTAGVALYTANDTWGFGGGRNGNWARQRIRYRIGGGYFNLNLAYYRNVLNQGEKKYLFNFRMVPFYAHGIRQIAFSKWYAGLQYLFLQSELKLRDGGDLPEFAKGKSVTTTLSLPGILLEYDARDNFFTPNKGMRFHINSMWSNEVFGSDYNYVLVNSFICYYFKVAPKLTGGLRLDVQHNFGNTPFYMLGYISMRGIPIMRYQGQTVGVTEAETRWDFTRRWSTVMFAGVGKTFNENDELLDDEWAYSGGAGFRYLLASKFNLRCGVDIARGPEQWAYYLVIGNAWIK